MTADELAERLHAQGHVVSLAGNTNREGAAAALEQSVRTLDRWRACGFDSPPYPAFVMIGRQPWYPVEALAELLTPVCQK